jgi:porphobilinogen deaminase
LFRREDARDAVIIHPALKVKSLAELPKGSIVGELKKHYI